MRTLPILAAALLWALPVTAETPPRLTVTAQASVKARPDMATIGAGVVTQAPDAGAALAANGERMGRVVSALKRAGVADRDIRTAQVTVQPQYRYGDGRRPQITGYEATNSVTVRLRDLARVGPVIQALVAEGANRIDGPAFGIDRPEPLLDQARAEAVRRARARAEVLAAAAGVKLGRVLEITEGDARPPIVPLMRAAAPMAAEVAAAPPVEPGEQEVSATVTIVFEIG
ncbi:MAG: SIMPL domain-containing protein [Sphingomonadaceae bacterium]|uniref:SIMPL domain-containing protein n=1 Tax=Thermaurantiacus sp. TaxID=2820283 RepID=UPI00298EFEAD|nr:SIMPL domain-containing protein [Thermaurantiacus sp.]MCS6987265.1 SIMPL domain-containing protein [Sphingomonadaceae bacterium]MDW8414485.1 SIMPL domain-containing protein [Thermaurantiacus sp.]